MNPGLLLKLSDMPGDLNGRYRKPDNRCPQPESGPSCAHKRALPAIGECPYCTLGVPEPRPVLVALEYADGALWTQSGFDDEDQAHRWAQERIAQGDVRRCSVGGEVAVSVTIHEFAAARNRAAAGDREAAARYRSLAGITPERADEWLARAAESEASAARNLEAIPKAAAESSTTFEPRAGRRVVIAAVLLVPTEAHREALIGDGPCGSRAPVAIPEWVPSSATTRSTTGRGWTLTVATRPAAAMGRMAQVPAEIRPYWWWHGALVLAWDGKPVADGLARLARFFPIVSRASIFPETMASVIALARRAEAPLGRVVLLDAAVPEHT